MKIVGNWLTAVTIRIHVRMLENFPAAHVSPSLSLVVVVSAFLLNAPAFGASLVVMSIARDPNIRIAGAEELDTSRDRPRKQVASRLPAPRREDLSVSNDELELLYRQLMQAEQQDSREGRLAQPSGK